jgi:antitoxin HigA-1
MWSHTEEHPGEYLRARFLEPLGLSAADLARGCQIPRSRVSDILSGKRAITADTALRLGSFFRMQPEFWMSLQAQWDLHHTVPQGSVTPLDPPGFLIGPAGVVALSGGRRPLPRRVRVSPQESAPLDAGDVVHEEVRYANGTRALVARPV